MKRFSSILFTTIFFISSQPSMRLDAKDKGDSSPSQVTQDEALLKQISRGFANVAKEAIPATVYIESQGNPNENKKGRSEKRQKNPYENPFESFHDEFFNRFFGFPYEDDSKKKSETVRGSGFMVSSDGYIMTNCHVVENTEKMTVSLQNGKKYTAQIIGTDPKTDLAMIKIDEKNLPYLHFGDSDKLEVGDWAIALGSPFGLQATVTVGVVSAKGRNQLHINDFEDFIQTDAAINPGNSGGPLLNVDGQVIGINTAIVTGSGGYMGIGFAIPSNMASRIKDQLIKNGFVTRGYMGVTLQPLDNELASYYKLNETQGALVAEVASDSPAEKAGLKQEDIILSYNNIPVDNMRSFRNAVSFMEPGSKVHLEVLRDGKKVNLTVTIAAFSEEKGETAEAAAQKLGIKVQNLTPEIAQQLGFSMEKGVVITQVQPETPAAEAGLRSGSLILAVNRKRVMTVEEFQEAMHEAAEDGKVLLMVRQGDTVRFVAFNLD